MSAADETWRHRRGALVGELAALSRALVDSLAGTGKTQTAAELCLTLALEHGVAPDRIRLLTFNEKAAREGRERVRRVTETLLRAPAPPATDDQPAFSIDARARALLEDALRTPPVVQTIHAFAQEVLGVLAFDVRAPLQQRLVGRTEAFHEAFLDLVRRHLAGADAAELQAWLDQRSLERLERLLRRCTAEEPGTELRPTLDPDLPRAALARVAALPRGFWTRLRRWVNEQDWGRRWRVKNKLLELSETVPGRAASLAATGARLAAHDPQLAGDLRYVLAEAVLPDPAHEDAWSALGELQRLQVGFDAAAANLWTRRMAYAYREHKRARGLMDFDDLLRLLEEALALDGEGLRGRARALADVVIVDECQDQNVTIYGATRDGQPRGIFRPLFFDPDFAGRAYLSGDAHQSLYGWRGADIHGGFLRARADVLATPGARVLGLRTSFRSTPRLLDAINAVLDQQADPPFFRGPIRYDDPAVPGRPTLRALAPDGRDVAPFLVLEVQARKQRLDVNELRRAVAHGIADELERLRGPDHTLAITLHEHGAELRRLTLDDCFVIVRSHREAALVRDVLVARGIPALLHRAAKLHASPESEDVADVLAALAEPDRDDLRLRAFATPLVGVPHERLTGVRDLPPSHPLVQRWQRWVTEAERDLPRLLASLLDASGLPARERLGALPGGRTARVYQQVLDELVDRATRVPGDAARLLVHLERLRAEADGEDAPSIRQDAAEPSVRVMTVFAAKGLSTGVVFLMGGFSPFVDRDGAKVYQDPGQPPARRETFVASQGDEKALPRHEPAYAPVQAQVYHDPHGTRVLHVGPLDAAATALYQASSRQDNTCFLYTAMTRAVARVVVPFVPRVTTDDGAREWLYPDLTDSYHEPLNERLEALLAARPSSQRLRTLLDVQTVRDPSLADDHEPSSWSRLSSWAPPPALTTSEARHERDARRALILAHRPQQVVSYSSLKHEQVEPIPPVPVAAPGDDGAPSDHPPGVGDELPVGRRSGNLLHALLERCDLATLRRATDPLRWGQLPQVRDLLAREADLHGFGPDVIPHARDVVFHTLTRTIDLGGRLVRLADCEPLRREVRFRVELPGAPDTDLGADGLALRSGFLHGALDALLRLPGGDGAPPMIVGLDWKSDRLADYSPATAHEKTQQDYRLQVMAYSYALARLADASASSRPGGAADVRLVYVYLRGTGVVPGKATTGIVSYPATSAGSEAIGRLLVRPGTGSARG